VRLPDVTATTVEAVRSAGAYVSDLFVPTVRLGVTGLAGAGKTVFITTLVRNLISGGRLPFFAAQAERRLMRAWLEPQPDDAVPRFDYEAHLAHLFGTPPQWPESTRRISELRLVLEFMPSGLMRHLGSRRINIDIVDYPGEWLIDLGLLDLDYPGWSRQALKAARSPARIGQSRDFLALIANLPAKGPLNEQAALPAAAAFTDYLARQRATGANFATLGPGRFLMPGDLAGSPLLTFCPLEIPESEAIDRNSLGGMMARRFESYKTHVVRPFFRDHFSRIDRQIVLIDVLGALDAGGEAVRDLEQALDAVLSSFRPGTNSWLSSLLGRRVDRLLFAATKADHLHRTSHDRLEAVLRLLTDRARARAKDAGARVDVLAMAALRATREAEAKQGREMLPCIVGVPMPGERIGRTVFDGEREAAVFPGDLPADPEDALAHAEAGQTADDVRVVRFRPPRLAAGPAARNEIPLPNIRLDRAIEFLIGDRLQ